MAVRRGGTTTVRWWRPRRLNLELERASMNYGEPSAQDFTASGGREWRGHDDGVGGGAPVSCARRWSLPVAISGTGEMQWVAGVVVELLW